MEDIRQKWETEQSALKQQLILESQFEDIRYIGGVDISFVKDSNTDACVCLMVLDYNDLDNVVYEKCEMIQLTQPYIPGFLAFRECDHIIQLLDELKESQPEFLPQLIMVDGNGILHPRGFGLASHLGVLSGIPCMGVAKNFLWIEDLEGYDRHKIKELSKEKLTQVGAHFPLVGRSGTVHGACLRATKDSVNPVFVSPGHKVSLEDALAICLHCSKYRVPEPVRKADKASREALRQLAS